MLFSSDDTAHIYLDEHQRASRFLLCDIWSASFSLAHHEAIVSSYITSRTEASSPTPLIYPSTWAPCRSTFFSSFLSSLFNFRSKSQFDLQEAVRWQIQHLGADWKEGEVIMSNHPAAGGSHLPDVSI